MTFPFGASAPLFADLVLVFELAVGGMLLVGSHLAHRGRIRLHMYVQSSMVLINIPVVLAWMVPHYLTFVLPDLPGGLGQPYYLVPTLMLVAGAAAEALGVYIILVAGTTLIPERFRFRRYKLWMRSEVGLWWGVLIAGISTYYLWYLAGTGGG